MATRQDLIDDLRAAHPELSRSRANAFVKDLLATVAAALHRGDSVRLAGFGTFVVKQRATRIGRNPSSGASISIPAKKVVRFRPSAPLQRQVNTTKSARRGKASKPASP